MSMSAHDAVTTMKELLDLWVRERRKLTRIDGWARWSHDAPHKPRHATPEYKELAARSEAPWGDLIVTSVAQTLYVEGYRRPDAPEDSTAWECWQANGMDGRQVALHRSTAGYGYSYVRVLPGQTLAGEPMPQIRGISPRDMIAVYDDPVLDEWPVYALQVSKLWKGYRLTLFDNTTQYELQIEDLDAFLSGRNITGEDHGAGVTPIIRFTNRMDLEGRIVGEIEPYIPLLGRIDQTTFDRLVVQRFASWIVRTIAGMSVTESAKDAGQSPEQVALALKVGDLLTSPDKETKFGSLPATPLDGFIRAAEADLQVLAAVTQTPAFELLGDMANLSADALAAAKASQDAKSQEHRHVLGEQHEQTLRLACWLRGDKEGAQDFLAQVRWADTSIRSLAQAADALGKLATMLKLPPEVLWHKVPGLTQQDIDEAKEIVEKAGGMDLLLEHLRGATPAEPAAA